MTTLYHARRVPGDSLKSELLPTEAPAQIRNGKMGQYLYATHRMDQAFLYALPFPDAGSGTSFMDTAESGDHDGPIVRFHGEESKSVRAAQFSNRVYSLPSDCFEQVTANPREWISSQAVSAQVEADVVHIDQALSRGVQYFTLANGAPRDLFSDALHAGREGKMSREFIADLIARPESKCVWENEVDGLGLDSQIASLVDAKRVAHLTEILGHSPSLDSVKNLSAHWRLQDVPDASALLANSRPLSKQEAPSTAGPLAHDERMMLKDALSMAHAAHSALGAAPLPNGKLNSWRANRQNSLTQAIEHAARPQAPR